MLIDILILLFERDLKKVIAEIELYKNEENIWRVEKSISNSAGNLTLHLIGNLNTYIGKTNYVRNRELEFSQKNVPRKDLIEKLNDTIKVIKNSLLTLTNEELRNEYPILVFSEMTTTEYLLVHLTTHLTYHLGQINYHRRLIDE